LSAVKVVDVASQAHILAVIQGVGTIVNTILALVTWVSSKAQVAAMATASTIKLAEVRSRMWQDRSIAVVAAHYGEPATVAAIQVDRIQVQLDRAGF